MDTLDKIVMNLKQQGKTQKNLTDYLNLEKGIFSAWKAGRSTSYLKHIGKIAKFLDISTDYLLGNETKEKSPPEMDELDAEFLDIISTMTKEQKQLVLKLAKQVID